MRSTDSNESSNESDAEAFSGATLTTGSWNSYDGYDVSRVQKQYGAVVLVLAPVLLCVGIWRDAVVLLAGGALLVPCGVTCFVVGAMALSSTIFIARMEWIHVVVTVIIAATDLYCAAEGHLRVWPVFVPSAVALMRAGCHPVVGKFTQFGFLVWLLLVQVDQVLCFGLATAVHTTDPGRDSCGTLYPLVGFCVQAACIATLVLQSTTKEEQQRGSSVDTTPLEAVLASLVEYNVGQADVILRMSQVPCEGLLSQLVVNMIEYEAYLPASLVKKNGIEKMISDDNIASPVLPSNPGDCAVLFTEVRGSSSIWEANPAGMKIGVKLYQRVVRTLLREHSGVEIKTIGESFMIYFETARQAVEFGLDLQTALLAQEWPKELLAHPMCTADKEGLWRGLQVRVGVHFGPVSVDLNAATGRHDVYGTVVAMASRLGSAAAGGSVCFSEEMLSQLRVEYGVDDDMLMPEDRVKMSAEDDWPFSVDLMGSAFLRSEQVSVFSAYPLELAGRRRSEGDASSPKGKKKARRKRKDESTPVVAAKLSETELKVSPFATAAVLEVLAPFTYTDVSSNLKVGLVCLDRCSGSLNAVVGSSMLVSWNVATTNSAHIDNAFYFLGLMRESGKRFACGMATGRIYSGSVGTSSQLFNTLMGDAVSLAWALCEHAKRITKSCLYAPLAANMIQWIGSARDCVVPLEEWDCCGMRDAIERTFMVCDVRMDAVMKMRLTKNDEMSVASSSCWTAAERNERDYDLFCVEKDEVSSARTDSITHTNSAVAGEPSTPVEVQSMSAQ